MTRCTFLLINPKTRVHAYNTQDLFPADRSLTECNSNSFAYNAVGLKIPQTDQLTQDSSEKLEGSVLVGFPSSPDNIFDYP